jgi:predicted DNA-binding protein with PD1-like motif
MRSKRLSDGELRTYAVVLDDGEEASEALRSFARREGLSAASVSAVGGFRSCVLGFFEWSSKRYLDIPVEEQVEILWLGGDVALKDDEPEVHAHVVVGRSDASTRGGHLMRGLVRPTLEAIITETPGHLRRVHDERSGLALIDPAA